MKLAHKQVWDKPRDYQWILFSRDDADNNEF